MKHLVVGDSVETLDELSKVSSLKLLPGATSVGFCCWRSIAYILRVLMQNSLYIIVYNVIHLFK